MNPRHTLLFLGLSGIPLLLRAAEPLPTEKATPAPAAPPTVSVVVDRPKPDDGAAPTEATAPHPDAANGKAKSKLKPSDVVKPVVAAPLSPRFLQVRARITALFAARTATPPPPDPRFNPFRASSAAAPVVTSNTTAVAATPLAAPVGVSQASPVTEGDVEPVAGAGGLALLQQAVGHIKIKGTVRIGTRIRLSLNTGPGKDGIYGEGDVVNILVGNEPVPVRIRTVTRNSVTLTLGDSEMVLRF